MWQLKGKLTKSFVEQKQLSSVWNRFSIKFTYDDGENNLEDKYMDYEI